MAILPFSSMAMLPIQYLGWEDKEKKGRKEKKRKAGI